MFGHTSILFLSTLFGDAGVKQKETRGRTSTSVYSARMNPRAPVSSAVLSQGLGAHLCKRGPRGAQGWGVDSVSLKRGPAGDRTAGWGWDNYVKKQAHALQKTLKSTKFK